MAWGLRIGRVLPLYPKLTNSLRLHNRMIEGISLHEFPIGMAISCYLQKKKVILPKVFNSNLEVATLSQGR